MSTLLAAGLAAGAGGVLVQRPTSRTRLARVLPAHPVAAAARPVGGRQQRPGVRGAGRQAALACGLGGVAVALVVGGPVGLALAAVLAAGGPRLLSRLEPRSARDEAARLAQDLPLALDLLAACLSGGAPVPAAVRAVAQALPGPCGTRFGQVAAALAVGSAPAEAWAPLARGEPAGASAARALGRAGEGGAPVAAAVARIAADTRVEAAARATSAARRAGVLAVGPLGLCFLPAFVLLGIVPAVIGLGAPLLSSL